MAIGDRVGEGVVIREMGNIQITVLSVSGTFVARRGEDVLGEAKTLAEVEVKLKTAIGRERVRISVPFVEIGDYEVRYGEITGKHARTGNWLVNLAGRNEQHSSYTDINKGENGIRMRPLSPKDRVELAELLARQKQAREATAAFMRERAYSDLKDVATKAWKEAGGA